MAIMIVRSPQYKPLLAPLSRGSRSKLQLREFQGPEDALGGFGSVCVLAAVTRDEESQRIEHVDGVLFLSWAVHVRNILVHTEIKTRTAHSPAPCSLIGISERTPELTSPPLAPCSFHRQEQVHTEHM